VGDSGGIYPGLESWSAADDAEPRGRLPAERVRRGAHVEITVFFADRDPAGPYRVTVGARRTRHVRFNDLTEPAPIPAATDYASVIESDVPIVVQHTRLDSRQSANALITTMAYAEDEPSRHA
jgi:hypothetical protein